MLTADQEIAMFDYPLKDLQDLIAKYQREKKSVAMLAMSMISDAQDMAAIGLDPESVRRTLNRAKYVLSEVKETL